MTTTTTPFTVSFSSKVKGYGAVTNRLGQNIYVDTETLEIVSALLDMGSHLFLYGVAGTAKTELAEAILASKGRAVFQMETGSITGGDQLDGEKTLDKDGKIVNIPSELMKAMKQAAAGHKVAVVLDELNRVAAPAAVNKLLRPLSNQREYATDLDGVLEIGDNALFVATANIGYFGTTRLNEALLDRFDPIEMKPLTGEALNEMIKERYPTVDPKVVKGLVRFSDTTRTAAERDPDGDLQPISTRDILRVARGITAGLKPVTAVTRLVGGQLAIRQADPESIDALVSSAKAQFGGV